MASRYYPVGSHSYTVPAGISQIAVLCVGPGGNGFVSNSSTSAKPGGGGGCFVYGYISVTAGQTYDISVGAGGSGQPSTFKQTGTLQTLLTAGAGGNGNSDGKGGVAAGAGGVGAVDGSVSLYIIQEGGPGGGTSVDRGGGGGGGAGGIDGFGKAGGIGGAFDGGGGGASNNGSVGVAATSGGAGAGGNGRGGIGGGTAGNSTTAGGTGSVGGGGGGAFNGGSGNTAGNGGGDPGSAALVSDTGTIQELLYGGGGGGGPRTSQTGGGNGGLFGGGGGGANTTSYGLGAPGAVFIFEEAGSGSTLEMTFIYNQTVDENQPFSVQMTANRPVTWSKDNGYDSGQFSLNGDILSLPAKDYESPTDDDGNNSYRVQVRATANDNGEQVTNIVTVNIVNVAEGISITSPNTFNVNENQTFSQTLTASMSATWTKIGGADQALFNLNPSTGLLTMAAKNFEAPSDSNTDNAYVVMVRATNGSNTADQTITVTVQDVDETSPDIFGPYDYQSYPDKWLTGKQVYLDEGSVTWGKTGTHASYARVDPTTGDWSFNAPTNGTYYWTLTATDPAGNMGVANMVVTVSDVETWTASEKRVATLIRTPRERSAYSNENTKKVLEPVFFYVIETDPEEPSVRRLVRYTFWL